MSDSREARVAEALAEHDGDDCFSPDVELPGEAEQRSVARAGYLSAARAALAAADPPNPAEDDDLSPGLRADAVEGLWELEHIELLEPADEFRVAIHWAPLESALRAFRDELTSQYGMRYEGSWLVGRLDEILESD